MRANACKFGIYTGRSIRVFSRALLLQAMPISTRAPQCCAFPQAQARTAAKEAENAELLAMCDQLLQQQEAVRTGQGA